MSTIFSLLSRAMLLTPIFGKIFLISETTDEGKIPSPVVVTLLHEIDKLSDGNANNV